MHQRRLRVQDIGQVESTGISERLYGDAGAESTDIGEGVAGHDDTTGGEIETNPPNKSTAYGILVVIKQDESQSAITKRE